MAKDYKYPVEYTVEQFEGVNVTSWHYEEKVKDKTKEILIMKVLGGVSYYSITIDGIDEMYQSFAKMLKDNPLHKDYIINALMSE